MNHEIITMDGNQAAAHVAYAFSETAAIYPITPSSGMAEYADEWACTGRKNIFGETVIVTEMQSEAGAAGAVHGSLVAGALTSTFTSSQGLLLMIPNIYRIAGELLPGVFHVAARTIATHALSIFGDHSDVYSCRQTGAAMLCTASVQEIMDLAPVAHLTALKCRLPFIHFFDGFRTSHEMQKISVWDYETLKSMMDYEALTKFRENSLNPNHRKMMGSAQNPDIFFQCREAQNKFYDAIPEAAEKVMTKINTLIGTDYHLFNYNGAPQAEHIIIAMGSVCETIEETIRVLNEKDGRYGLIKVRLYRPFSANHLISAIPDSVRQITVLDRTKEPGSAGEPLYLDVLAALSQSRFRDVPVFSGRYGLSSKDTTPSQIAAVLRNLEKQRFTIGINDDVTHLSLDVSEIVSPLPHDIFECKFWGLGGDGTVSANKSSIKIIGGSTDMNVQAYFEYDSKKSRGLTISHLRFGKSPIHAPYLVKKPHFSACHNPVYMHKFEIAEEVQDGGIFLLNCGWNEKNLCAYLPENTKKYIIDHNIKLYVIDAMEIAKEIGLNGKISTILQAAFFKVTGILPEENAKRLMKEAAQKAYGKKGEKIVRMNFEAIDKGMAEVRKVELSDHCLFSTPMKKPLLPDHSDVLHYVENVQIPITKQKGDSLPVSAFLPYVDGSFPMGTTAHERRNVATEIPVWIPEKCIQCTLCSYVCPHAVIRPAITDKSELDCAPTGMKSIQMNGLQGLNWTITISEVDCTGCGSCVGVCPGKKGEKALVMTPIHEKSERQQYFDYGKSLAPKNEVLRKFKISTIKGSQLRKPLLEFHGACAGCGETPYARLATQLFGERMYIANATGCSSIWANSSPSTAYTISHQGTGPAWSNSLFEDGAEFGFGMLMAQKSQRKRLLTVAESLLTNEHVSSEAAAWINSFGNGMANQEASNALISAIEAVPESKRNIAMNTIISDKDFLAKKSCWIFGGDGFAYDIGFNGIDHVLASGCDINILIFDTEVYSNTGGQASKATPKGAEAKFASGGKKTAKKPLAEMMMAYGNVYVAQIAMGADYNQTIKAFTEAESYNGPSLIIAYSPCISHGIKAGMGSSQHEQAKAVQSGYWRLFRFDPRLSDKGENPFVIDSREPSMSADEFMAGETRFRLINNN